MRLRKGFSPGVGFNLKEKYLYSLVTKGFRAQVYIRHYRKTKYLIGLWNFINTNNESFCLFVELRTFCVRFFSMVLFSKTYSIQNKLQLTLLERLNSGITIVLNSKRSHIVNSKPSYFCINVNHLRKVNDKIRFIFVYNSNKIRNLQK